MTTPYLYKFTNKETNQYYIGCRYTEGCDPEEGFEVYASSSRIVKKMIRENPTVWEKNILLTGTTELVLLEEGYLIKQHIDNPLCLNGLSSDGTRRKRQPKTNSVPDLDVELYEKQLGNLGERIKKSRITRGYTQQMICDKIGISRSTMSNIEKSVGTTEIGIVLKAMQVVGLTIIS